MNTEPVGSGIIVPERPAFPFLLESNAAAKQLPLVPGQPPTIAYVIALAFVDSPALTGKALTLEWRQGVTATELAKALRKAAGQLDDYVTTIRAREAAKEQAANEESPPPAAAEPGKNGAEQPLPAPGNTP